ncbi:hypothetical protein, partial [Eubacterium sp.]
KYSVKKHKEKPNRVYLAYKKVDNNRIEKEKRKVANDYLTQTSGGACLTLKRDYNRILAIIIEGEEERNEQSIKEDFIISISISFSCFYNDGYICRSQ